MLATLVLLDDMNLVAACRVTVDEEWLLVVELFDGSGRHPTGAPESRSVDHLADAGMSVEDDVSRQLRISLETFAHLTGMLGRSFTYYHRQLESFCEITGQSRFTRRVGSFHYDHHFSGLRR